MFPTHASLVPSRSIPSHAAAGLSRRALLALLACAPALTVSAAPVSSTSSVASAAPRPLPLEPVKGSWSRDGASFTSGERGAVLAVGELIAGGDFSFAVDLRVDRLDANPARIRFDEIAEVGFVSPTESAPHPPRIYVRGFLFGDRTMSLGRTADYLTTSAPARFEITRAGDQVSFSLGGRPLHQLHYEGGRPLGKITFEPVHGTLTVSDAVLRHGRTAPLSSWVHPARVTYPRPGGQIDVFRRGEAGYHTCRIPALTVTSSGTLLAFCEGRRNSASDRGDIDLLLKRSLDGGRTWSPAAVVHGEPGDITIGNPVPVVDRMTGIVWLAFCRDNERVFVTKSSDDGVTWSPPREITASVRRPEWASWYATGPCHGLQLSSGRLVIPANHGIMMRTRDGRTRPTTEVHAIYSDDHGRTWTIGASAGPRINEVTMAERSDSTVVLNARATPSFLARAVAESRDGGVTWTGLHHDPVLVEPVCQGSLLAARDRAAGRGEGRLLFLFSNPASVRRERLTIRLSEDEGRTWPHSRRLYEGPAAYSDLCDLGNGTFGCLYERDRYERITFARFTADWVRGRTPEPEGADGPADSAPGAK